MIVDTSAVVAIFLQEPGYEKLISALSDASNAGMGTPTLAETGIVLTARLGYDARGVLSRFLQEFEIVEVPFGEAHWRSTVEAYSRFGIGRHKAALNFGDCMSYATASLADQPLLFVGNDFSQTDVKLPVRP